MIANQKIKQSPAVQEREGERRGGEKRHKKRYRKCGYHGVYAERMKRNVISLDCYHTFPICLRVLSLYVWLSLLRCYCV